MGEVELKEPESKKSRGIILKAFFEVKMLLVQAAAALQKAQLPDEKKGRADIFIADLHEDCCKGGFDAQFDSEEASANHISSLLCGALDLQALDGAWADLQKCVDMSKNQLQNMERSR